jgi:hypothetical protein
MKNRSINPVSLLPVFFLLTRLVLLLSLPLDGLRGYGDFVHFYRLAQMGWPFIDIWVEFPPFFPFLSALLFQITGDRQHGYDYLLVILLSLLQAGNIYLFIRLGRRIYTEKAGLLPALGYTAILAGLAYGWWYFDPLAELFMLLGLLCLLEGRDRSAGVSLAMGVLTKWFPALVLPVVWKIRKPPSAAWITALTLGIPVLVYAGLSLASPQMTLASLSAQGSKGSWETVWALVDGNLDTGNFGPEAERVDPATARLLRGQPARVPAWLSLLPFLAVGAWLWLKARLDHDRAILAFVGLTWCLFLLWSPGWSTQWVLYLLPLILLALPVREGILMATALVLVNLLEWPVLLSRGYNWGLWLTIPVRTLLLVLLAVEFWRAVKAPAPTDPLDI